MFKQLIPKQYRPIVVGMHIKRSVHETPRSDENNRGDSLIRVYNYYDYSSGGLGGYGGLSSRSDEGRVDRLALLAILSDLHAALTKKYMYADLRVGSHALFLLLKDALRRLRIEVSSGSMDVRDAMHLLYTMYVLVDTWNRMVAANKPVDYGDLSDEVINEYVENYDFRLDMLLYCLRTLHRFSEKRVVDIVRNITISLRTKLENVLNGSYETLGVDAMAILDASVRFQIISKKRIRNLVRDLRYTEDMIGGDIHNATLSIARVGRALGKYIKYSWKRLRRILREDAAKRRRVRYGSKGSKELQFVTAVKSLIRQVKSFKDMLEEIRGLENIRYLDRAEFSFEAKEMLSNAFPCFLYADRVVCVDISDLLRVVDEAEEVAKYTTSFCRYCLGIRVKPSVNPCSWGDEKCLERFCRLYDELLNIVNGYRELLKKLREKLRGRAKMRKRRYRQRLRKLVYKLSKTRSLNEYISGDKEDPFTRAINAFNSWLRRRGYMSIQDYSYDDLLQKHGIPSTELYHRFTKILDHVNGWVGEPSSLEE